MTAKTGVKLFENTNVATNFLSRGQDAKTDKAAQIIDVKLKGPQLVITCKCNIILHKKALVVATIEDKVCGIEVLNPASESDTYYQQMNQKEQVAFQLTLDKSMIEEHSMHLLCLTLYNDRKVFFPTLLCSTLLEWGLVEKRLRNIKIQDIFPSIGFFGGARHTPLSLPVNDTVSGIRVVIENDNAILNIAGLRIYNQDGIALLPGENVTITCSSDWNNRDDLGPVLTHQSFHSQVESHPWLELSFDNPISISRLVINNRKDKWGMRAKHLAVYIKDESEQTKLLHSTYNDEKNLKNLSHKLAKYLNISDISKASGQASKIRKILINKLIKTYYDDESQWHKVDSSFLKQLLCIWNVSALKNDSDETELKLLSMIFVKETTENLNYDLRALSGILRTRTSLLHLEQYVNELRSRLNLGEIQLSKHAVVTKGLLCTNVTGVMKVLTTLMAELSDLGYKPCLAYGTLLGACREKAFITHDDDVDILIELTDEEITASRALELRDEFIDKLCKKKYRIEYGVKHNLNVHVYERASNIMIDVFPYWFENNKTTLYMERMELKSIEKDIFEGRQIIDFYGYRVPIPAKPDAFLCHRYGPNWTISDRFHEWQWELKD